MFCNHLNCKVIFFFISARDTEVSCYFLAHCVCTQISELLLNISFFRQKIIIRKYFVNKWQNECHTGDKVPFHLMLLLHVIGLRLLLVTQTCLTFCFVIIETLLRNVDVGKQSSSGNIKVLNWKEYIYRSFDLIGPQIQKLNRKIHIQLGLVFLKPENQHDTHAARKEAIFWNCWWRSW